MMHAKTMLVAACAAVALAGCAGGWWPFGGSGAPEPNRIPAGATEYSCAEGKRLLVRYTPDGKSAWVIYPDREFRLDRAASASGEQFSNGITTLATKGEEVLLDSEGTRVFSECKKK